MRCDQDGCNAVAVVGSPSGSYCFEHSGFEEPTVTVEPIDKPNEEES